MFSLIFISFSVLVVYNFLLHRQRNAARSRTRKLMA